METQNEKDLIDSEWENRTLCNDGNCIGIIGDDGRCKECGLPYEEEPPGKPGPKSEIPVEPESDPEPKPQTDSASIPDEDWENRILCPDGNCIGVIGPEGLCKACGKSYKK
jgi:hypothetical protein